MDSSNDLGKPLPSDLDADVAKIRARREVVKRMLRVAAVAPMAAMLFDPKKALADGTGTGGDF